MVIPTMLAATGPTLWAAVDAPAVTGQTLTVSPTHGTWSAPFTATYTEPGFLGLCSNRSVTFVFDGLQLGEAELGSRRGECSAVLTVQLPADAATRTRYGAPGPHTVSTSDDAAAATYTLDPDPPPSRTPDAPTAPARPSAGPGTSPAAPSSAGSTSATNPAAALPSSAEPSESAPSVASVDPIAVAQPTSRHTGSIGPLVLGTGVAILLGGALLIVWATGGPSARRRAVELWDAHAVTQEVPVVAIPPPPDPDSHPPE